MTEERQEQGPAGRRRRRGRSGEAAPGAVTAGAGRAARAEGDGARPEAAEAAEVAAALRRATDHLFEIQHEDGYWKGELETNVTMDAEDLLLRQFLGIRDESDTKASAAWIRSQQRSDGSWSTFYEGPADLSTTIEAYVALRLAGDETTDPHMAKAAEFVREAGGLEQSRVFTRLWMALFGLWSWDDLPALPPEVIFLPSWFPLNVYDFACWARQTIVALTVVAAHRPQRPLQFGIEELRAGVAPAPSRRSALATLSELRSARGALRLLDKGLHQYERLTRLPLVRAVLREPALAAAERWIVRRQEADGGWGGIQPPWVYSLMALSLRGYPLDHPVIAKGLAGLEGFTIKEDGLRRFEACQSPVWDTGLALIGLADAGIDASDDRVARSVDWLVGKEITVRGDWAVRRPALAPGGWAFEFANDNYPDIDDTAEVILALRRATEHLSGELNDERLASVDGAVQRGRDWVAGMVSKDGGWGAFDADNTRELCKKLPFCDFGAVIDPPSADVTAHVVEMLAYEATRGAPGLAGVIDRGVQWLEGSQETDGSWFGRWGANYVYGTGAVLPALVAAGTERGDARVRRGIRWLAGHQNPDGGFGEDLRSYVDADWRGRGASTASQTAWALLAFVAAGEASGAAARRAAGWLARTQRADGSWDEPWFTGTGFPGDFYINYHLYRLVWPVSALGRWLSAAGESRDER